MFIKLSVLKVAESMKSVTKSREIYKRRAKRAVILRILKVFVSV